MINIPIKTREKVYVCVLIGMFFYLAYHGFQKNNNSASFQPKQTIDFPEKMREIEEVESEQIEKKVVVVDIRGAVRKPGVYTLDEGKRLYDLIIKAGGLVDGADVKRVNQAIILRDEEAFYIPLIGEEGVGFLQSSERNNAKVSLNKSSKEEFEKLSGIGPSKASSIVEYRTTNGPFNTIEEVKNVSGIGEKLFQKIKDELTIN